MVRGSGVGFVGLLILPFAVSETGTGVPPCAVRDKGYTDPNVPVLNGGIEVQDAQTCQNLCKGLVTCQAFTFWINSGGCWLQGISGELPPPEPLDGVWSGPAVCEGDAGTSGKVGLGSGSAVLGKELAPEAVLRNAADALVVSDGAGDSASASAAEARENWIGRGTVIGALVLVSITSFVVLGNKFGPAPCKKLAKKVRGIELDSGSPRSFIDAREPGSPTSQASFEDIISEVDVEKVSLTAACPAPRTVVAPPVVTNTRYQVPPWRSTLLTSPSAVSFKGIGTPVPAGAFAGSMAVMTPPATAVVMEPMQVSGPPTGLLQPFMSQVPTEPVNTIVPQLPMEPLQVQKPPPFILEPVESKPGFYPPASYGIVRG